MSASAGRHARCSPPADSQQLFYLVRAQRNYGFFPDARRLRAFHRIVLAPALPHTRLKEHRQARARLVPPRGAGEARLQDFRALPRVHLPEPHIAQAVHAAHQAVHALAEILHRARRLPCLAFQREPHRLAKAGVAAAFAVRPQPFTQAVLQDLEALRRGAAAVPQLIHSFQYKPRGLTRLYSAVLQQIDCYICISLLHTVLQKRYLFVY